MADENKKFCEDKRKKEVSKKHLTKLIEAFKKEFPDFEILHLDKPSEAVEGNFTVYGKTKFPYNVSEVHFGGNRRFRVLKNPEYAYVAFTVGYWPHVNDDNSDYGKRHYEIDLHANGDIRKYRGRTIYEHDSIFNPSGHYYDIHYTERLFDDYSIKKTLNAFKEGFKREMANLRLR